jgi:phosphatidylglycerol:prolipoprotein diacylglycerol transferase
MVSVKPVPVVFHLGPVTFHTYGLGLGVTFLFAYWYLGRRLDKAGLDRSFLGWAFFFVLVGAILGARAAHVFANWSYYAANPSQILAIWQGGLSSFGGLAGGLLGGWAAKAWRSPALGLADALDAAAPVLVASWALGRLLGPQLMVAGGGRPTNAFYGMYYAGQIGKRVPVPLFQSADDWAIFGLLIALERNWPRLARRLGIPLTSRPPRGLLIATGSSLWGLSRYFEEATWLARPGHVGSELVEGAGLAMAAVGAAAATWILLAARQKARPLSSEEAAFRPQGSGEPQPLSR